MNFYFEISRVSCIYIKADQNFMFNAPKDLKMVHDEMYNN